MNRFAVASVALVALATVAHAQPSTTYPYNLNLRGPGLVSPYNSSFTRPGPNLSPYLNLLRGGNPAANYYLGVLPEVERRNNASQFAAGIQDLSRRFEAPPSETDELFPRLPQTGHPVQFGNYGQYFGTTAGLRPQQAAPPSPAPRRR
jgi:hypothetical protein